MKKRNVLFSLFGMALLTAAVLTGCSGLADPLKKATISFDQATIKCTLANDANAVISSGSMIAENTALRFVAQHLPEGKVAAGWTVNGKPKATMETFIYYVNLKELKLKNGATITIGMETKDAEMVTLNFDQVNISCTRTDDVSAVIKSGSKVADNTTLRFMAQNLPADQAVVGWTVNKTRKATTEAFIYHVNMKELKLKNGETITIGLETEAAKMVTLNFDKEKVFVYRGIQEPNSNNYKKGSVILHGTAVKANEHIFLYAKLTDKKLVDKWKFNEREITNDKQGGYVINPDYAKDVNGKKIIDITFTEKTGTVKITFNENKVTGKKDGTPFRSGSDFSVGDELKFTAKPAPGKAVANWKLNEIVREHIKDGKVMKVSNEFPYTVDANDVTKEGTVDVSFTDRNADMVTITYDDKKMTASYKFKGEDLGMLKSGTAVKYETELTFKAKLEAGQSVKAWYADVYEKTRNNNTLNYTVDMRSPETEDGNVNITCVLNEQVKISFAENEVLCARHKNGKWIPAASGETWNSNDQVRLTSRLEKGEVLEGWYRDDEKIQSAGDRNPYIYDVTSTDAQKGSITLSRKLAAKLTLTFDAATVREAKYDTYPYTTLTSGTQLNAGTRVTLEARVPSGKQVQAWVVNGRRIFEKRSSYDLAMSKADAIGDTIHVKCEFEDDLATQKIKVSFDKNKIKCTKTSGGTEVSPNEELPATSYYGYGDELTTERLEFTAKDAIPAGKTLVWYVNGVKQRPSSYDNTLRTQLRYSDGTTANIRYEVQD